MPRTKILSLIAKGTPEFPRYLIADQFMHFWTGNEWTKEETKGALYNDTNAACVEMQKLLLADYAGLPKRRYRAPVYLDLYTAKKLSKREVMAWLVKTARLLVDSPRQGNGPLEGTLGLCRIEWGEIEELPSEGDRS